MSVPGHEVRSADEQAQIDRLEEAWRTPTGWRYWSSVNNSNVGLWYIATAFIFFFFAGALALLMRLQLAAPDNALFAAETYNQMFSLHGSAMMFLFAVPIFEAFAILVLPQMLGARDLPFPRLSAYGFWCFVIGGLFVCGSIFFGAAPQGGWFMYPPLTTAYQPGIGADIWLLGLSFIEVASIAAAVELITGVLKTRAPGMQVNLMPLYAWYILVVAVMILFAFPPLIAGDIMFELQRALDWPFFDPARGGDPMLWQHLFWIFGHPEVYIVFLPSVALAAMIVPTFARRPVIGYSWIVLAAVGTGFLSFGLWVHHMFTTGLPNISLAFFSAASEAVALPTGVQIFVLLGTVLAGRLVRSVPMLFVLGALAIFVLGGLTGVMVAVAPFDFQVHDTYFIVAHLHYVLIGGMLFPVVAGAYYFYPLAVGRKLSDRLGKWAFWLMFAGFNVAFMPMHIAGLAGMPRRVFTYPGGYGLELPNLLSTIGAFVLAAGFLLVLVDAVWLVRRRELSPRDPWRAGTLEWLGQMPAKPWAVRSIPQITSRYPLWQQPDLMDDVDSGRFFLADAAETRRETLVTSPVDATPEQCMRMPGPSYKTLLAAVFTGAAFILPVFGLYRWAALGGVLAVAAILWWLWTGTALRPEKPSKDVGMGVRLPLYVSGPKSAGWWGLFITMIGDMAAFASLVFGYYFFWTVHEGFPPRDAGPGVAWPVLALGLLLASWVLTMLAVRLNRRRSGLGLYLAAGTAAALGVAGAAALVAGPRLHGMDPTAHVYPAIVWLLAGWTVLHVLVGVLMQLYCLARRARGHMDAEHDIDIRNATLYWHFVAITALVTVATIAGFPQVA
ncbi:cytochrome c oxidase subunit I [Lysobacter sp. GX 14042]|uniref:cytochrome c oxidase subunit I n=1 Tax=Lysobacter sp. GX 14042 TaxID=2907155 RepID=UPI001F3A6610|nr:cytochrome c oxidase subunit I [Lysobacter sp. GX 14042]MCE7032724.1 cytochrome c oxidase subunit I [Lysobacter sp. GX 14042]